MDPNLILTREADDVMDPDIVQIIRVEPILPPQLVTRPLQSIVKHLHGTKLDNKGINITCTHYSGEFGPDDLVADMYVTEMEIKEKQINDIDGHIIFVVDNSRSMAGDRIDTVKKGLRAMADLISEENITIILFSDNATLYWNSTCMMSFDQAIQYLCCRGGTNLEDGMKLALKTVNNMKDEEGKNMKPTWIICMTDGHANIGQQSTIYFNDLFKKYGPMVKTITIGIGDNFSDDLLRGADHMTHAKDLWTIYDVMGTVLSDIKNFIGYNARLSYHEEEDRFDSILAIGTDKIGFIQNGQKYTEIYMPHGHSICGPKITNLMFSYTKLCSSQGDGKWSPYVELVPVNGIGLISNKRSNLPESHQKLYFKSRSAKIIEDINQRTMNQYKYELIKEEISKWNKPIATPFRDMVLNTLNEWNKGLLGNIDRYEAQCVSKCMMNQRSYGVKNNGILDVESFNMVDETTYSSMIKSHINGSK